MEKDYYQILGISRNASIEEIKSAYKKKALKWHPDRNPRNKQEAEAKFQEISEAYEVLGDAKKKSIYDQHGMSGLKGESSNYERYSRNGHPFFFHPSAAEDIFAQFFGQHPFSRFFFEDELFGHNAFSSSRRSFFDNQDSSQFRRRSLKKQANIACTIEASLEDLYHSRTTTTVIDKKIFDSVNREYIKVEKTLKVKLHSWFRNGTQIRMEGEGHELPGNICGDVIFTIIEKHHSTFERMNEEDLHHLAKIQLKDALDPKSIEIPSISGKKLQIDLANEVISPGMKKVFQDEGMPTRDIGRNGKLIVTFDVEFPKHLTKNQQNVIREALTNPNIEMKEYATANTNHTNDASSSLHHGFMSSFWNFVTNCFTQKGSRL